MIPLPTTDPRRVVAYRRVSSVEQGKAFGPAAQERAIREFARREGLEIVSDVFEDRSGTLPLEERPGLQDALAKVYEYGAGGLLVARRDRLARDEYAAHDAIRNFAAAGARVLYADGSNGEGDGALLADSIMHAVAADDRRRIVARLKAGRDAKAREHPESRPQGGKLPYGYRRVRGNVEVDPEEAEDVRRIFDLIRGGKSIRAAAQVLSDESGRTWHPNAVARIVKRPIYKAAEPGRIIDPRIFNQAQRALQERRRG